MSRKNDMMAALECRQPEGAVPIWEIHFHCWVQASGKRFISGRDFMKLTPPEQEKALVDDAEIIIEVSEELNFAGATIPDAPWDCPYTLPPESRLKLAQLLRERTSAIMIIAGCGGVMGMPGSSNYAEFCYKLFDAPEEIDDMAKRSFEGGLAQGKRLRDAGVEAVYIAADMADNHGPFFRPEQMDRYVLPYLSKLSDKLKEMGMYVMLHTDGDLTPILSDLADTGIHAIQAIDPVAGMDIQKAKEEIGDRTCLCGNVDTGLLVTGPSQDIYGSTCDILQGCKQGGGLVLGASNAVVLDTPIQNYYEVIHAWRDYGQY